MLDSRATREFRIRSLRPSPLSIAGPRFFVPRLERGTAAFPRNRMTSTQLSSLSGLLRCCCLSIRQSASETRVRFICTWTYKLELAVTWQRTQRSRNLATNASRSSWLTLREIRFLGYSARDDADQVVESSTVECAADIAAI